MYEDLGGYLVESNQGHFPKEGTGFANNWELFDASAESAIFAKEIYGTEPHHGYVWGGSGGGARSAAAGFVSEAEASRGCRHRERLLTC